jgi:primase-polymerase (primpol)-like protein
MRLLRADAKFCSTKCRVYSSRRKVSFPAEMTSRRRWVRRDGNKVPLTGAGRYASSTNSKTWTSFEEALRSPVGVGLGFVLNGDGVAVIDLDDCFVDGELAEWAAVIMEANAGTFVEVSQSGRGIHIWGLLPSGQGRRIRDGRKIEIYSTGRYIAMGTPVSGAGKDLLPLKI